MLMRRISNGYDLKPRDSGLRGSSASGTTTRACMLHEKQYAGMFGFQFLCPTPLLQLSSRFEHLRFVYLSILSPHTFSLYNNDHDPLRDIHPHKLL